MLNSLIMQDIRIYIAEQRGETSIGTHLVRSTLNYGSFAAPHREAIGRLQQVNSWQVALQETLELPTNQDTVSFLIPLVGDLLVTMDGQTYTVPVGTILVHNFENNTAIHIKASSEVGEPAIFQEFVLNSAINTPTLPHIANLPLSSSFEKNKMYPVGTDLATDFQFYFGAFAGKHDFELQIGQDQKSAFAFALDGNFEVEERILYPSDGLYLPDSKNLDIECLSATGLLVVLCF
ncbi:hypothetical protein BV902_04320 [Sphingobacterium sp. B29]|nr:hypothetical protein BV902_04320 [Sphingobacterium sp. B29]